MRDKTHPPTSGAGAGRNGTKLTRSIFRDAPGRGTRRLRLLFLPAIALALLFGRAGHLMAEENIQDTYKKMAVTVGQEHEVGEKAKTFSPEQLPGLRLWLRSDSGVTRDADGLVSAWADPERSITLKQAKPELQPMFLPAAQNGKPALRMNAPRGDPNYSRLSLAKFPLEGERITLVVVARVDTPPYKDHPGGVGNLVWYGARSYGPESFGLNAAAKLVLQGTPPPSVTPQGSPLRDRGFTILQIDIEPSNNRQSIYENGELLGTAPRMNAIPASAILELGGFHGAVAEVIVLNQTPDVLTRAVLTRYLQEKYGLRNTQYITPVAAKLPFAYYPSVNEIEFAFDMNSPLLQEYFRKARQAKTLPTQPGVAYAYYTTVPSAEAGKRIDQEFKKLDTFQPAEQGVMPVPSWAPALKGPVWVRKSPTMNVLAVKGYIDAPTSGTYTFSIPYCAWYQTIHLYVADELVVEKPYDRGACYQDLGGAITLSAGKHPFFYIASVPSVLADQPLEQIFWTPPGEWSLKPVPAERFSHDPADTAWREPAPASVPALTGNPAGELKTVEASVISLADGKTVKTFPLALNGGGRGQKRFPLPDLADGRYAVDWKVAGKTVRATRIFTRKHFPWEKNTLGLEHKIYPPFKEIEISGENVSVVDREFTMNSFGCFDRLTAKGKDVLAGPIQLVAEDENGKRVVWKKGELKGKKLFPDLAEFTCTATSDLADLKAMVAIEEDGCARVRWELKPGSKPGTIKRMWLEIPYRDDETPLFQAENGVSASFGPAGLTPRGGKIKWFYQGWAYRWWQAEPGPQDGIFWTSNDSENWGGQKQPFTSSIWLGGPTGRGLCWFGTSGPDHFSDGAEPFQELERRGDKVILRTYCIKQPLALDKPLHYEFGLLGTPGKPKTPDWRTEKIPGPNGVVCIGGYMCSSKYPDNADFSIIDKILEPARKGVKPDAAAKQSVKDWFANRIWKDQVANFEHIVDEKNLDGVVDRMLSPAVNEISYIEEHSTFPRQPDWQVFQDEWCQKEFARFDDLAGTGYSGAPSYNDFAVYYGNEYLRRGVSLYFDNGGPRRFRSNPFINGFVGEANAIWEQRSHYKRLWKRVAALNGSGEVFRPVFTVGNAQAIPPHSMWFSASFGSEVTGQRRDGARPSRTNEFSIWDFSKNKGFLRPHARDLIQTAMLQAYAGNNNQWGVNLSQMLPTDKDSAMKEAGMHLVHEMIRPYNKDGVIWGSYPSPRQYGLRLADYFTWFGYGSTALTTGGRTDVAVYNYWDDKPFLSISDPDVAWMAMVRRECSGVRVQRSGGGTVDSVPTPDTRLPAVALLTKEGQQTPAFQGLLLLQSYKDDATTVSVRFPDGAAMMDMFTRELFSAGKDGKIQIPVAADYGVRLLAVGKDRSELPPAPGPDDVVTGDFELGMPGDLDFLYHKSELVCSIVEDARQQGNHVLRLKRPMSLSPCSPAREMADQAISFRFRLPGPAEKTQCAFSFAWKSAKGEPNTTQYDSRVWVNKPAEGGASFSVSKPRAVVDNKAQTFADIGADLTDKPLPGIMVDTNWHTLSIETRGARHVIRFDDQTVFEGTSNLVPAGGFSLTPGYDPYIEIDDLRIRRK